jgi:hypothetical protein
MRTRIVFAMAFAAALVCSTAHAEEWVSLSKTSCDRPTEIFIDMSSIEQKNNIRTAHMKYVSLLPRRGDNQSSDRVAFGIQPMSFDCEASLVRADSVELHYRDTERLGFIDIEKSWKPADPLTKKILDLVCAFKSTRPDERPPT